MAAKILSTATAALLLIASSTLALAQNSTTDQRLGEKWPQKALMDPKADAGTTDMAGRLTQENEVGGTTFAPAQDAVGPTGTTGSGESR